MCRWRGSVRGCEQEFRPYSATMPTVTNRYPFDSKCRASEWDGVNYSQVKRLRQVVCVLTLGLTFGLPIMACLVNGTEMSAAERECCKHMAQDCGSMSMPASHSCCQTEVQQASPMLHVEPAQFVPQLAVAMTVNVPVITPVNSFHALSAERHPPPESPPSSPFIMRV